MSNKINCDAYAEASGFTVYMRRDGRAARSTRRPDRMGRLGEDAARCVYHAPAPMTFDSISYGASRALGPCIVGVWRVANWRPLTWFSRVPGCPIFGLNAGVRRVVNVVFDAANTVKLFLILRSMTVTLVYLSELMEAAPCCGQALRPKPDNLEAGCNVGYTLFRVGRREEAIGYYGAHFVSIPIVARYKMRWKRWTRGRARGSSGTM